MNPSDDEARRARVSAVMDGQAEEAELQRWLAGEAGQGPVRQDWHTYHLIGDVMRSSDLASDAAHDQRSLSAVRQAVAQEPVVLAPAALAAVEPPLGRAPRPRWRLWAGAAAAVGGVAVVLSSYLLTRVDPVTWGSVVASVMEPAEDIRRASVGAASWSGGAGTSGLSGPWSGAAAPSAGEGGSAAMGFREILRLPRGPAGKPMESVQLLYSNGSATISVVVEPFQAGVHVPHSESSERLNTLAVQRQGKWLTLSGDVPLGTLQQMALSWPAQP
ncbi:MAG: MucB/RseB C-terminal domain-containing protein [Betaproteobacteria bacterium]